MVKLRELVNQLTASDPAIVTRTAGAVLKAVKSHGLGNDITGIVFVDLALC